MGEQGQGKPGKEGDEGEGGWEEEPGKKRERERWQPGREGEKG